MGVDTAGRCPARRRLPGEGPSSMPEADPMLPTPVASTWEPYSTPPVRLPGIGEPPSLMAWGQTGARSCWGATDQDFMAETRLRPGGPGPAAVRDAASPSGAYRPEKRRAHGRGAPGARLAVLRYWLALPRLRPGPLNRDIRVVTPPAPDLAGRWPSRSGPRLSALRPCRHAGWRQAASAGSRSVEESRLPGYGCRGRVGVEAPS